jgi:hypothetical protein
MIDRCRRVGLFPVTAPTPTAASRPPVPAAGAGADRTASANLMRSTSTVSLRVPLRKRGGTALHPALSGGGKVYLGLLWRRGREMFLRGVGVFNILVQNVIFDGAG